MKLLKKILIWVACLLVASLLQQAGQFLTIYSYDPLEAGSISFLYTAIVYVIAFFVAKALCQALDDRTAEAAAKKAASQPNPQTDENAIPPALVVSQPEEEEEIITTATAALEELEAQSAPAAPVKVSWNAPSTKSPSAPRPKRARSKLLMPVCVLAVLLLLSLGGNVYQYLHGSALTARISELDAALSEANNDVSDLENELKTSQQERNSYKNKLNDLESDSEENQMAATFLRTSIAFVLDDGTNLYHSYVCPYVQEHSSYTYWAYNIEAAKWNGYRACPQCADNFD